MENRSGKWRGVQLSGGWPPPLRARVWRSAEDKQLSACRHLSVKRHDASDTVKYGVGRDSIIGCQWSQSGHSILLISSLGKFLILNENVSVRRQDKC
jgi:hypothetical protein